MTTASAEYFQLQLWKPTVDIARALSILWTVEGADFMNSHTQTEICGSVACYGAMSS